MKYPVLNQKGEEIGQTLLPKEIFDVELNSDLIYQVVVSKESNKRISGAHAKGRGDVSGGGKKPWKQKGTGRARHGSRRSPIWVGGGVSLGPTNEKVYARKINKKMSKKALFMVLTAKAKSNWLQILDELKLEKPKTKLMVEILNSLPCKGKNSLVVLPSMEKSLIFATRNIDGVRPIQAKDLNILDLLKFKYVVMPKESIKLIKETFLKKDSQEE